jgi:arylsulfatase A-like enzyme
MNIVLIVVDTLRYDYIGANGNDWVKTPNLDRLALESWGFDRFFSSSYPTVPNRRDLMTGRYGGPFHPWQPLPHNAITFPWLLAENGYCTQLIHDTPHLVNGGHNFDFPFHSWRFVRGAEVDRPWISDLNRLPDNWAWDPLFDYCDKEEFYKSVYVTYARANAGRKKPEDWNCAQLFMLACDWLKENRKRKNFFLWVDCFDPHEPWDAPPEFMRMYDRTPNYDGRIDPRSFVARNHPKISGAARNRIEASYGAKLSHMDSWLGRFLDTLEETGLDKSTAVILLGDHGTNVGERDRFGKGYPVREQEGHVPLFIRVPGVNKGRCDIIAQPQDIFATILGLAAVPKPRGIDSHDLLSQALQESPGSREVAISGHSVNAWNGSPKEILFTVFDREWYLEFAADPQHCRLTHYGSLEDVADAHPSIRDRLRSQGLDEIDRRGLDPSLVAWLRAEGRTEFPKDATCFDGFPGPAGFTPYFKRLYKDWLPGEGG